MKTLKGLENLEEILPKADIPTAFELTEDPYGKLVLDKMVHAKLSGEPIRHDIKDWRQEVLDHFTQHLQEHDPFLPNPKDTALAGFIIGFLLAYTEHRAGDQLNGAA